MVANISIEPVSPFDDGLRLRTARAIYRDPVLSKYAMDPARPIRIIVENGHVTLYGSVDSTMDKTVAGMRANQIPAPSAWRTSWWWRRIRDQSGM